MNGIELFLSSGGEFMLLFHLSFLYSLMSIIYFIKKNYFRGEIDKELMTI